MKRRKTDKTKYYVDKVKLTDAVALEAKAQRDAIANKEEVPVISDYVAGCIFNICNKLSESGNFRGYIFVEDMVGDAIVDCVAGVKSFDPTKETRSGKPNAFGYFTAIAYFAFVRRINKEKKHIEKMKKYKSSISAADVSTQQEGFQDDVAAQVLEANIDSQILHGLKYGEQESESE